MLFRVLQERKGKAFQIIIVLHPDSRVPGIRQGRQYEHQEEQDQAADSRCSEYPRLKRNEKCPNKKHQRDPVRSVNESEFKKVGILHWCPKDQKSKQNEKEEFSDFPKRRNGFRTSECFRHKHPFVCFFGSSVVSVLRSIG